MDEVECEIRYFRGLLAAYLSIHAIKMRRQKARKFPRKFPPLKAVCKMSNKCLKNLNRIWIEQLCITIVYVRYTTPTAQQPSRPITPAIILLKPDKVTTYALYKEVREHLLTQSATLLLENAPDRVMEFLPSRS